MQISFKFDGSHPISGPSEHILCAPCFDRLITEGVQNRSKEIEENDIT